jgi:hypothetical protein
MKRFTTLGRTLGLVGRVAIVLFGVGCVNLDRPEEVAECVANNTCSDGEKKDAAVSKDDAGDDAGSAPNTDARIEGDSVSTNDGGSADRSDASRADSADTGADTATDLPDAGKPDSRMGDDTAPDVAPSADAPFADAPKDALGPDTADAVIADSGPLPMDTGPNNVVTFNSGKGVGAMTGYGWVALGSADYVSSPTCGAGAGAAITASAPCLAQTNWGTANPTALCVTGSIPSTTTSPNTSTNWGIQVGLNAKDPDSSGIGQTFKTVTVKASNVPTGTIRIEIHRRGDSDGSTYCATWTNSTTSVALTSFNTNCWDTTGATGTKLTEADLPKIDKVGLQVSPSTADNITLTNLCLQSITFGN